MGKGRGAYSILVGDVREGDNFKDPGVNGRIQLKGAQACTGLI
jgi:hypothetical protein